MISYKCMERELKRLPKLIALRIKEGELEEALEMKHEMETLEWILSDND